MTNRYSLGVGPNHPISFTQRILHFLLTDLIDPEQMLVRSEEERMSNNCEKGPFIQELEQLARDLAFEPRVHMVRLDNYAQVITAGIPQDGLVLNLCDGSDIDGVPGPCVAAFLEEQGYSAIVGCDSLFIRNTLTKHGMKELFTNHLVSTPHGFVATRITDLAGEVERLAMTFPLFVKISDSYGSVGIDDSNVIHDLDQLRAKCALLFTSFQHLMVEEYIDGEEYSVLVLGNCRDSEQTVIVYPPAERYFPDTLSRYQKFVSFARNWGGDKGEALYGYRAVADPLDAAAIQDLSRRAYAAVSGNAYGRVDIRRREVNGKFYVLEVNASCGLGHGSSSEQILGLAGHRTQDFIQILVNNVLKRHETRLVEQAGSALEAPIPDAVGAAASGAVDQLAPLVPLQVETRVARLISQPSISVLPSPAVQVIVSAVLVAASGDADAATTIIDPEGKLAYTWGKDAEYISELETIFRAVGYDPITHLYQLDDVQGLLASLKPDDLIFNACFGREGQEISALLQRRGMTRTVGVNAAFMEQSASRTRMRELLQRARLRTCTSFVLERELMTPADCAQRLAACSMTYPVYVKPERARRRPHGRCGGRLLRSPAELAAFLAQSPPSPTPIAGGSGEELTTTSDTWMVEEYVEGTWYLALVAGDARDPYADVIVFPPISDGVTPPAVEVVHSTPWAGDLLLNVPGPMTNGTASTTSPSATPSVASVVSAKGAGDLMLQMDLQDLARRAFVAVHGSCYGLVHIVQTASDELVLAGVSGDIQFGSNSKAFRVLRNAELDTNTLVRWLLKHPVKA